MSLVVLLIASGLEMYFNYETQQRFVAAQQRIVAQEAASTVQSFINEKFSVLDAAAAIGNPAIASHEEQNLILNKLLGLEPAFRQLALIDAQNRNLAEVSRLSQASSETLADNLNSDLIAAIRRDGKYISPVFIDKITSEPMVIIAVAAKDVFGDFKGVLAAEVNLKFMWDLVGGIKIGRSGLAYVVDDKGDLIAFGDISRVLARENLLNVEVVKEFVNKKEAPGESRLYVIKGIHGTDVVSTYVPLGTPDWAVVVELPASEAYEDVTNQLMMSVWITLMCFALAIVAGVYLSKRITRPIIKLKNIAENIGKGNLNEKIEISSKGEIGELATAFKQMIGDLKQSHEQIEKHAQEMELKVQERTKELDAKVNELTETKNAVINMMEDMDQTNKELVETQEELRKSLDDLKMVDVKKDEFISIAAHELKTPLTSIHGFSQLLQNRDVAKNPEKREKYLKIMDNETDRLAKLVTDILDLSRIDLGTVKFNLEEIDLNKIMEDVEREMNVQMKAKGLKSEYYVGKLPKMVTDRERLTEILINLINNAVKYTPSGKITVKVSKEKDDVHFMIKDTGIGIAKENYDKLFHRFYQIDSSYTRKSGGTGLGLALCKEFVTLLGGRIWFSSEIGKGSEFHFTLPIKSAPKSQMSEEEAKARERLEKAEKVSKKFSLEQGGSSRPPSRRKA